MRRGEKKGEKFQIFRRTEFYKLFEAGCLIIHLMLHAAVRHLGNILVHDSFYCLHAVNRKCVTTSGSGDTTRKI